MSQIDLFAAPAPVVLPITHETGDERCQWCGVGVPVAIVLHWPTCAICCVSRTNRIEGYQRRLGASVNTRGR